MTIQHLGRTTAIALVAAALSLAGCKPAASTGAAAAPTAAPAAGAFTIQAQPDLGPENQALPRFSGGDPAIAAKLNAAMGKLDASNADLLTSCPEMAHGGRSQTVKVTRNGPDFVAVEAAYESDCGAYPSSGTDAYLFDLKTGGLIDWAAAVPEARITNSDPDTELFTNSFFSPVLQARIVAAAKAETDAEWRTGCVEVLEREGLYLTARINTETGTLDVTPELPHVVQACANSLSLTPADLTALKADPRLIAAVRKG